MNYLSIGSSGGIRQIRAKTVDFGASDAPLTKAELEKDAMIQFPTVFGGVVPVVNFAGVGPGQMKLTGPVLADIYMGKITKWNDKAIAELNPGMNLPNQDIGVVRRADGSGTSAIFTNYLSKVSPEWKEKVGEGTTVQWPVDLGGKGNEGVSAFVQRLPGSIGYVESAYAKQNKLAHVQMKNAAGNFVEPNEKTVAAAAAGWGADGQLCASDQRHGSRRLADCRRHLHHHLPGRGKAAANRRGAEVLRLGLQERRQDGAGTRLRTHARDHGEAGRRAVGKRGQGRLGQGSVAGEMSSAHP